MGPSIALIVARAGDQMVIGEASCLHERVHHSGTHKAEAPPYHVLAHGFGFGSLHWNFPAGFVVGGNGLVIDKGPQILGE